MTINLIECMKLANNDRQLGIIVADIAIASNESVMIDCAGSRGLSSVFWNALFLAYKTAKGNLDSLSFKNTTEVQQLIVNRSIEAINKHEN